ncbi:hypothetical protein GDO81_026075 [Engystomops pustulosus]|uniref:Uncharacterized protein n=1 Tax=Engystomops pustulosus TaxID=76066 RepID=A0AAV6ZFH2_ENGPU|nr:hypothetical protein GDO81_026075 [Engystomops pustulosus]
MGGGGFSVGFTSGTSRTSCPGIGLHVISWYSLVYLSELHNNLSFIHSRRGWRGIGDSAGAPHLPILLLLFSAGSIIRHFSGDVVRCFL